MSSLHCLRPILWIIGFSFFTWPPIEDSRLESDGVVVEEVEVDQEVKASLRRQRVVEQRGHGSPNLKNER